MVACKKVLFCMFALWLFWFSRLLYGISPYFIKHGDFTRSYRELRFWFFYTLFAYDHKYDFKAMRDYYIYPEDFPDFSNDEPINVFWVDNDNITQEIFDFTFKQGKGILVWRNATQGATDKIDIQWIRDNFDMEKEYQGFGDLKNYHYYNDSDWDKAFEYQVLMNKGVRFGDFVDHTLEGEHRPLYLGFNHEILHENPKPRKHLVGLMDKIVAPFLDNPSYYTPMLDTELAKDWIPAIKELFFFYYGTGGYSTLHSAFPEDSFLQIHNTKRWIFTHPRYTPYLMANPRTIGVTWFIDYEEVPKVPVDLGPGDYLYFPPSYPHTVINMEETWGMGFGLRDATKTIGFMIKNVLFGSSVEGNVGSFACAWFNFIKNKLTNPKNYAKKRSGNDAFKPDLIFDAFQIQQYHKHVADCHNKFAYLFDSTQERGVEYGNGRGNPNGVGGPNSGLAAVRIQSQSDIDAFNEVQHTTYDNPQRKAEMAAAAAAAAKKAEL